MKILGIDTSCDDTSAAVVEDGKRALSNVVHTQIPLHRPYGGVVPELASREHIRNIWHVVEEALRQAEIKIKQLDGIAVTIGPGLVGSLLVGLYFVKGISLSCRIPFVGVNHLEGHILSIFLEEKTPSFPFVALTVSGGHTSLFLVEDFGRYRVLGQTLDDAAGEAFDKVAKILGLGYPGGRVIEELSGRGDRDKIPFPRAFLSPDSLDFSFSGLKTSVSLFVKRWKEGAYRDITVNDIAASFQEAVVDVLSKKLISAANRYRVKDIVIAGGVACNGRLRERVEELSKRENMRLFYPHPQYCTDNGAMIAVAGFHRLRASDGCDLSLDVLSRFPIEALDEFYRS